MGTAQGDGVERACLVPVGADLAEAVAHDPCLAGRDLLRELLWAGVRRSYAISALNFPPSSAISGVDLSDTRLGVKRNAQSFSPVPRIASARMRAAKVPPVRPHLAHPVATHSRRERGTSGPIIGQVVVGHWVLGRPSPGRRGDAPVIAGEGLERGKARFGDLRRPAAWPSPPTITTSSPVHWIECIG